MPTNPTAEYKALAAQFEEMADAARRDGEYDRADVWRSAASQTLVFANNADRLAALQGRGEVSFEVWQDGMPVASASGPMDEAKREAMHYALMYGQDGPVTVYRLHTVRELITPPAQEERANEE